MPAEFVDIEVDFNLENCGGDVIMSAINAIHFVQLAFV